MIGGGWAARFVLNGWNVQVFDPDPQAERKIGEVMANARRSLPGLTDVALPRRGRLTFCTRHRARPSRARSGYRKACRSGSTSSTRPLPRSRRPARGCGDRLVHSGFKPSELQEGAARPDQIMVAHPFNPVYLLPLVELVHDAMRMTALVEKAKAML